MVQVRVKLRRFDRVAQNFPIVIRNEVEKWRFDVENTARINITNKFKSETGLLRASVRSDIKGGIKPQRIKNPRKKGPKTVKKGSLIARFLAGTGDSIQDKLAPIPYATQRERGGFITPVTAAAVTVPINDAPRDGARVLRESGRSVRIKNIIYEIQFSGGKSLPTLIPRYVLKALVPQKPRPYMEPAVKDNLPALRTVLKDINNKKLGIPPGL